ncbi:putative helicase [Trueperella bonasi]|uniref:Helicase n=1 Tax=Trueperella bonasi TaxID=312286 RepID=A0ABT9NGA0_9ACTO|nr:type ISP restriction/modification enzyme [Trueperella bonasi]MDP9806407.1 putative helicase [Trueperella bonasi]
MRRGGGDPGSTDHQPAFVFPGEAGDWKDSVYAKIVKKVGNREYWDDWSKDIADIASRYINLIELLLEDPDNQDEFKSFVEALQSTLNPSIDSAQAVEMLAQHLITKPLFDAMFPDQEFTALNPVSRAMQGIVDRLATSKRFEVEREPLADFYATMTAKIEQIDNLAGKQDIMRTLYDRFFTKAFSRLQERLGIVFTPVEVVDYILHSAEAVMQRHFGKSLADDGVATIDPFLGTGTFVTRLLQSGIIPADKLERKYLTEIFANEVVLLSYYIASINIEQVYREVRKEQGASDEYVEFPGISLTDTFQMYESDDKLDRAGGYFEDNTARALRQKDAPIRVVVMNPPYSAGQKSANDNNQNLKYQRLDSQIEKTYVALSTATNKNSLYDSYFRALRWATDRIGEEGVIAFVSNSSFIDGNTADGVRLTFQDEFSDIYVYNLRGNARTQGERRRQEGDGIFGEGSRTGVAITLLVKTKNKIGPARIRYAEVGDYLSRQEKLDILVAEHDVLGTGFTRIEPNSYGDWLNQRDDRYLTYQEIGNKKAKGKEHTPAVFRLYSRGLATARDAWCYNFSQDAVATNMSRMIKNYNAEVAAGHTSQTANNDPKLISWNRQLRKDLDRQVEHTFRQDALQASVYRPFVKQSVYFERSMNDMVYQLPQIFPTPAQPNLAFGPQGIGANREFSVLMADILPDLEMVSKAQWCPLYTWHLVEDDGGFDLEALAQGTPVEFSGTFDFTKPIGSQVPLEVGGYRRRENITDATLNAYRDHYKDARNPKGERISKEDIFFYVYALLHHPEYREKYSADLKKMLPRIPKVADFWSYANVGRELAELHVNYENIEPYPDVSAEWPLASEALDPWEKYRVEKLAWAKKKVDGGRRRKTIDDYTTLIYNPHLTFTGIPEEANEYLIGGRSPLEWMVDRYKITTDKESGIVNDPNDYCREIGNPAYIAELVPKLVTVSIRTQTLVASLPALIIEE